MRARSPIHRAIPGVLFAEDFDAPAPPAAVIEPAIEPVVDEIVPEDPTVPTIDLERLTGAARDEGFAAGVRTAEAGLEAQRVALLDTIAHHFAALQDQALALADNRAETIAKAAMSILLGCVPSVSDHLAEDELRRSLRLVLPGLSDEAHVSVMVSPSQEALARSTLVACLDPKVRVTLSTSAELRPGDVRVAWQDGSATRELARLHLQMTERLRALDLLPPDRSQDANAQ